MKKADYLTMTPDLARNEKWRRGAAKYGDADEHWVGEHPLVEAYEECLDLWNYLGFAATYLGVTQETSRAKVLDALLVHVQEVDKGLRLLCGMCGLTPEPVAPPSMLPKTDPPRAETHSPEGTDNA